MTAISIQRDDETYGPALDTRGNSIGSIYTMERLSDTLKLHVFDADNAIR